VNIFRFYSLLGITTTIATLVAYYAGVRAHLQSVEQQFVWWAVGFLVPLSMLMYHLGVKAVNSPNRFLFSQLSMFFTVSKLIISMILIIVFWKKMEPTSKYFVVPFLIEYFFFVAFETYFMVRIANAKK
jgi:hypothetical protein